jgi:hypothetical protein
MTLINAKVNDTTSFEAASKAFIESDANAWAVSAEGPKKTDVTTKTGDQAMSDYEKAMAEKFPDLYPAK